MIDKNDGKMTCVPGTFSRHFFFIIVSKNEACFIFGWKNDGTWRHTTQKMAGVRWSQRATELLIEELRLHRCLYAVKAAGSSILNSPCRRLYAPRPSALLRSTQCFVQQLRFLVRFFLRSITASWTATAPRAAAAAARTIIFDLTGAILLARNNEGKMMPCVPGTF